MILNSLEIRSFRAFRHLQIERLSRVNLIVGKNNVGQSNLLEALQLLRHYQFEKHINIEKKEGIYQLLDDLDVELDRSGLGRLGVVVDAHTWLAWQKEPGKPLGQTITKEYIDAAAPRSQQLIRWIRTLFDLEAMQQS